MTPCQERSQTPRPPGMRFRKTDRLLTKRDFDAVFAKGEKIAGPHFVGYWLRQEEAGCKLGLAVSRKVGGAVVRNRVKRLVREWYRTHRSQFQLDGHLVVVARSRSAELKGAACAASLTSLMRRGGVMA